MKIENLKFRAGFSMIELIVAVALLSIIIFGVVKLETSNLSLSNTQNNEIRAHFLVQQALTIAETIDLTPCATPICKLSGYVISNEEETPETIGIFNRTIEIEDYQPFLAAAAAKKATAIVTWTDSTSDHSVSAKRIIH